MALLSHRGMRVRLATALVSVVALAGCGGDGGEPAASNAADSVPASTQPGETTTAPGPSTSASAPATTAAGGSTTTTGRNPGVTSTTAANPRPGATGDFSVDYPTGWGPSGQVLATAFAAGASCGSALIVDRAEPPGSGPGASVEQSFVQVCWKGLEGKTLAQFMAATYGANSGFQATTLAGRPAQVSKAGTSATYFLDTSTRRYQVTTGVAASDALRAARQAQVDHVLASLTLPT
jgi:hypothetical protein